MSQGASVDVAQAAFRLGVMGYVVKGHAGGELLASVEAVCQGRQFVSKGLSGSIGLALLSPPHFFHQKVLPPPYRKVELEHSHEVQFLFR